MKQKSRQKTPIARLFVVPRSGLVEKAPSEWRLSVVGSFSLGLWPNQKKKPPKKESERKFGNSGFPKGTNQERKGKKGGKKKEREKRVQTDSKEKKNGGKKRRLKKKIKSESWFLSLRLRMNRKKRKAKRPVHSFFSFTHKKNITQHPERLCS